MIIDRLECASSYLHTHPGFAAAFDYLRRTSVAELPAGKHPIDGDRLYLVNSSGERVGLSVSDLRGRVC